MAHFVGDRPFFVIAATRSSRPRNAIVVLTADAGIGVVLCNAEPQVVVERIKKLLAERAYRK